MNVYEKLAKARIDFQNCNVKPTGKNDFVGYDYFDLSDILPTINKISLENKICCVLSFDTECATLDVVDSEKPQEKITFLCPMSKANLRGCHEVQNMGAVVTYITRYLYIMAFSIVEHETLDKTHNPNNQNQSKTPNNKEIQMKVDAIKKALEEGIISDEKQIVDAKQTIARSDLKGIDLIYNWLLGKTNK